MNGAGGALLAAAVLAAALGGCVENPEPDPRIGSPKPERQEAYFSFEGEDGYLTIRFERIEGVTSLSVHNAGSRDLDSGLLLVRMWNRPSIGSYYDRLYPAPDRQVVLGIPPLLAPRSAELGTLDWMPARRLDEIVLQVEMLMADPRGPEGPHPFSGMYAGAWMAVDTSGEASEGEVEGLIGAEGRFVLGLYDTVPGPPRSSLRGWARPDGSPHLSNSFYLESYGAYGAVSASGGFSREGGRVIGRFGFPGPGSRLDTLVLELEPAPLPR